MGDRFTMRRTLLVILALPPLGLAGCQSAGSGAAPPPAAAAAPAEPAAPPIPTGAALGGALGGPVGASLTEDDLARALHSMTESERAAGESALKALVRTRSSLPPVHPHPVESGIAPQISDPAFTTGGSSGSVRTTVTSEVDVSWPSLPVRRRT